MNIVEWLLISLCILIGCISIRTDHRKGIISNKIIVIGLSGAFVLHTIDFIWKQDFKWFDIVTAFTIVVIVSIALYSAGVWAGGDSKLFILMFLLLPERYFNVSSLYRLFSFTFTVLFAYLIIESLYFQYKKEMVVKQNSNIKEMVLDYCSSVCFIFGIQFVINLAFQIIGVTVPGVMQIISVIFVFLKPNLVFWKKKGIQAVCVVVTMLFTWQWIQNGIQPYYIIIIGIVLLIHLITGYISRYNYIEIKTSDVEKGMVLSMKTVLSFYGSKVKGLPITTTEDLKSRISCEEAEAIKRWESSKTGQPTIVVLRKIPFASFIVIGYWILILIGAVYGRVS